MSAQQDDRASEFFAPDVTWHGGTLGTVEGADNVAGVVGGFIAALPDLTAVTSGGKLGQIEHLYWRARQDSNLRPSAPEADALSTELQARGAESYPPMFG